MKHGLTKSVYHFVFDRLRSIRQDLIVQGNPDVPKSVHVLQICVRFHLLASYKLSNEHNDIGGSEVPFDREFNYTQLLECLKDLLILYEMKSPASDSEISGMVEFQGSVPKYARFKAFMLFTMLAKSSQIFLHIFVVI